MLTVEMTPNLLGFKIAGDYDDLDELYDAVWALTVADEDFPEDKRMHGTADEQRMSTRLLALCYDIRHAYQGSRNIEFKDSGMHDWDAGYRDIPLVEKNVVYSVEVLYPEAMFEALALNYLMAKRARTLTKPGAIRLKDEWPTEVMLDMPSAIVRAYLAKLLAAVEKKATKGRFARIRKELGEYYYAAATYRQWVDIINDDYARMTKKQRAERLSTVVRDLAQCYRHEQYREMKASVDKAAKEYGCHHSELEIPGLFDWSYEPEW